MLHNLGLPIDTRSPRVAASNEEEIMENLLSMVNHFAVSHEEFLSSSIRVRLTILNPMRRKTRANGPFSHQNYSTSFPEERKRSESSLKVGIQLQTKRNEITFQGRVLSPNLLSFHKDGIFSIPDIFNVRTTFTTTI